MQSGWCFGWQLIPIGGLLEPDDHVRCAEFQLVVLPDVE